MISKVQNKKFQTLNGQIGQVDTNMQQVRKATLEGVIYENTLLQHFKRFLQRLEKLTAAVNRKGHGRITPQSVKMAEVAVQAMCDLLILISIMLIYDRKIVKYRPSK